jgi:peptidoglycan/xylan/chitin deacetylase (PgdA/CDA1 family)
MREQAQTCPPRAAVRTLRSGMVVVPIYAAAACSPARGRARLLACVWVSLGAVLSGCGPKVAAERSLVPDEPVPFAAAEPIATMAVQQSAAGAPHAALPRYNPAADLDHAWLLAEGPDRRDLGGRRLVTLTFDDGPGPRTTDAVLRVLRNHRVKATFFMVASYFEGPSKRAAKICEAARHVAAEGHLVGNHSMHHRKLSELSDYATRSEINDATNLIEQVTGQAAVQSAGLELTMWTVEARDMTRSDPDDMLRDLIWQLEYSRGGVVLLHDVKWATVKVVDRLLSFLESAKYDSAHPERAGYEVVDLPTYMQLTAEHPQPFATRYALGLARAAAASAAKRTTSAKAPTQLAHAKFSN